MTREATEIMARSARQLPRQFNSGCALMSPRPNTTLADSVYAASPHGPIVCSFTAEAFVPIPDLPWRRGKRRQSQGGRSQRTATERRTSSRRPAKFLRENEGLPVVTIKFRRFALSTEIQTSSGPTPVDPSIAHDQADPGARDLWIGQIDILPDQPRALAMCINQPSAHPIVPVE